MRPLSNTARVVLSSDMQDASVRARPCHAPAKGTLAVERREQGAAIASQAKGPRESARQSQQQPATFTGTNGASTEASAAKRDPGYAEALADGFRRWMREAMENHQYSSAVYWGDKVVTLSGGPEDVRCLAQACYLAGQYVRAQYLLDGPAYVDDSREARCLRAHCLIKMDKLQAALHILEDTECLDCNEPDSIGASISYLMGTLYLKNSDTDKARKSYRQALKMDVRCFEAFQALTENSMLDSSEERDLIRSLPFERHCGDSADLVRSLYTSHLKKYSEMDLVQIALEKLMHTYNMGENAAVLLAQVDTLYTKGRSKEALCLVRSLKRREPYNLACRSLEIACLLDRGEYDELFSAGHDLIEHYPDHAVGWFAAGCFYFAKGEYAEARRHFATASSKDKDFGPAWMGFAHTFALEGEHEQALMSYKRAARYLRGSHLPALCMGMHYTTVNNPTAAFQYFEKSKAICDNDPLLWNEIGILFYMQRSMETAEECFLRAENLIKETDSEESRWISLWTMLGQVYFWKRNFEASRQYYDRVLRTTPRHPSALLGLAIIHHACGDLDGAILGYHQALAEDPSDAVADDLLTQAVSSIIELPAPVIPECEMVGM